jgi:hypothetical protein
MRRETTMNGRSWRDTPLSQRLEHHFRKAAPAPAPRPVAVMEMEVFELARIGNASLSAEELGERERIRASAAARRRIDAALEAEAGDAEKIRQDTHAAFFDTAALGRLMR